MVGGVGAVAIPEPGVLPDAGVGVCAGIHAHIASKDRVIIVDDGVDRAVAGLSLNPCKYRVQSLHVLATVSILRYHTHEKYAPANASFA